VGDDARDAVPVILAYLSEPEAGDDESGWSRELRERAVRLLPVLGAAPEAAVPVLGQALQDVQGGVPMVPDVPILGQLFAGYHERNLERRLSAVRALGDYGSAARPAVPALLACLEKTPAGWLQAAEGEPTLADLQRAGILWALVSIDPELPELRPWLEEALQSPVPVLRLAGAAGVAELRADRVTWEPVLLELLLDGRVLQHLDPDPGRPDTGLPHPRELLHR
jgi:hypothetical protein